MNLQCKVCGERAAGFHFGAFTCEGCKSFFGRCCNNTNLVGECKNNEECVIDKKNRTSCKACRLRKCLLVGMSKSGSRYGRRSNWFKQYFQEQEDGDRSSGEEKSLSADEQGTVQDNGGASSLAAGCLYYRYYPCWSVASVSSSDVGFFTGTDCYHPSYDFRKPLCDDLKCIRYARHGQDVKPRKPAKPLDLSYKNGTAAALIDCAQRLRECDPIRDDRRNRDECSIDEIRGKNVSLPLDLSVK